MERKRLEQPEDHASDALFVQDASGKIVELPREMRDLLKRYGLALVLAGLALFVRSVLPFPEGTSVYQLPIAAIVLSAWYGGRGPGLLALLICATGVWYWYIPPVRSWDISPEHAMGFSIFVALSLLLTQFSGARRRVEHALRASEERFRTLVQFSFDVYWESDAQHRFTRQEFAERLTDAPAPGSEIGKTRWEIPYLEPDEEAWRNHRATLDAHLPFRDFELARPTPDGGRRYVSVSGMPVFDEFGRFVGYRGVGRHITEHRRAEEERRAHVWFLESMDRVNRAMQRTNDLEQMMGDVLEAVLEIFASDRAWLLYPCDPDAPSWSPIMERTRPEFPGAAACGRDLPMTPESAEVARVALASSGALLRGGSHKHQPSAEIAQNFGVRSDMLMALRPKDDRPYLFGLHQCSRVRTWTKEEQRLFEEVGHRLTDALGSLIVFRGLRESERRLEEAQRVAHLGYWDRDLVANRVVLAEESWRIFGVEPHERPADLAEWNKRWHAFIDPDDRPRVLAAVQAALAGGPRYDVEFRIARKNGEVRVIHSQGDVIRDASGRAIRMFGTQQDITALRQAEKDLRASETRFRALVDHATDGFFLHADDSTVIDVNQQACRSLGYSREELIGMHPRQFDAGLDRPSLAQITERIGKGEAVTFETLHQRKDGSVFPVEVRVRQFQHGERRLHASLVRDISERKRVEAELRARQELLDLAQKAARAVAFDWYIGARESENRWSPELEALYGLKPGTFDGTYQGWKKLVHPDDWPAVKVAINRAHESGDIAAEYRVIHKDGAVHWLRAKGRMFFDAKGQPERMVGFMFDVTDWRHAEEALREKDNALQMARTELARVSRLTTLGELTASIAHEVNQPIGAMVTNAAACARWLAAQPPDMAEAQAALANIVADGKRAGEVIARIRALTRRQAPRMELLDVNRKVREVLALAEHELKTHGIVLRTELAPTLPGVAGDRVQLQQVLLNLIVNAIEAMSGHDRPHELTIVTAAKEPGAVVVEVRDSGPGLDEGVERVFEPFYTTKAQGIGIGLSISRSIVEAHGGRLWATSNQPHGAVFRFSLPVAQEGAA
jgi:PAS domain S-box-containing protein